MKDKEITASVFPFILPTKEQTNKKDNEVMLWVSDCLPPKKYVSLPHPETLFTVR